MQITLQLCKTELEEFYCQMDSLVLLDESGKQIHKIQNGDVLGAFKIGLELGRQQDDVLYDKTVIQMGQGECAVLPFGSTPDDIEKHLDCEDSRQQAINAGDELFVNMFIQAILPMCQVG